MSAIVQRYVRRIKAHELTILDVPAMWRAQVLAALEGDI